MNDLQRAEQLADTIRAINQKTKIVCVTRHPELPGFIGTLVGIPGRDFQEVGSYDQITWVVLKTREVIAIDPIDGEILPAELLFLTECVA